MPSRRVEAPLPYRLDGAPIEAVPEALEHPYVPHRAIAPDDDLEDDVAFDAAASRIFRIVGFDLAQQAGRIDSAARPVRPATCPAADAFADSSALSGADPA